MQSRNRCPKGLKTHLLTQILIQLCPVVIKESIGITSTRPRTVDRVSYSSRELFPRNESKT